MQFISTAIFAPLQDLGNMIILYREADAYLRTFDKLMNKPVEQRPENSAEIGRLDNPLRRQIGFVTQDTPFYKG
ncbi:hypothetical protein [Pedobacter sp. NJ-S-72]